MPKLRNNKQPTGKVDWETPEDLMKVLEQEFGKFDLDPCATYETRKAIAYYSLLRGQDGLELSWCKEITSWGFRVLSPAKVFVNPPYGRGIAKWVQKCYDEIVRGNAELVVALLPVAVGTRWWQDWCSTATEIRFLKGRVTFVGAPAPSAFESAIVVWRKGMLNWGKHSYWDWRI